MAMVTRVYVVWAYGKDAPWVIAICKTEHGAREEQRLCIYPTDVEIFDLKG